MNTSHVIRTLLHHRSFCRWLLPMLLFLAHAVQANPLDHLIRPMPPATFVSAVRSLSVMDGSESSPPLRDRTFVFPTVVLGGRDVFVYLEQSVTNLPPMAGSTGEPGFRVVEVRFHDQKQPTRRELLKRTFAQSPLNTTIDRSAPPGVLKFSYRSPDAPLRIETVSFGYSKASGQFESNGTAVNDPAWTVIRKGDGVLRWESVRTSPSNTSGQAAGSALTRRYQLSRRPTTAGYTISAELTLSVGQWSHTLVIEDTELPIDTGLEDNLRQALALEDSASGAAGKAAASQGLIYLPFPVAESTGKVPNDHKDAGLVIDITRLERRLISHSIDKLKLRLGIMASMDGEARDMFQSYVNTDADLLALDTLGRETGISGDVLDGLAQTRRELAGLVFRIPVANDGNQGTLLFSPGRNIGLLLPEPLNWTTSGNTLVQIPAPNDRIVFAMRVKETNPFPITDEQLKAMQSSTATAYNFPGLASSQVLLRPPPGPASLVIVDEGSGVARLGSLRLLPSAFTRDGSLWLGLSVTEPDANRLNALYFKQGGIPIDWDTGSFLTGRSLGSSLAKSSGPSDFLNPAAVIRSTVSVAGSFDLISDPNREVSVTIMLSDELRSRSGNQNINVLIAYPDDSQRQHARRVIVDRIAGEAVVDLPVRFVGGKLEPGLYYSIDDGISWSLAEDGLYGLVYVESE